MTRKQLPDDACYIPGFGLIIAVDGEEEFDEPGVSHGLMHFKCPNTGEKLGWSGIDWYFDNRRFTDPKFDTES